MIKNLTKRSSCHRTLTKNLIRPLLCRIGEGNSSRDLLSWSQVHIDDRDEADLVAQQVEETKN
jgi:hypothetical protein